jgi:hypothetical protein
VFQHDRPLGNFQFLRQKTAQRRVRFSFPSRGAQFDLDRTSVLASYLVGLRVWNDVKSKNGAVPWPQPTNFV